MKNQVEEMFFKLEEHSESSNFKGYDPYDALNSPILKALTFGNRFIGIIYVQLLKRSPINIRPILLIKRGINPKGFGLLISAYVLKYKLTNDKKALEQAKRFATWLIEHPSEGYSGYCWGYNFDWPNRNSFFPKGLPTIVNTSFIADAFLDLYDVTKEEKYLKIAESSCDFIIKDIIRYEKDGTLCFSYTPIDNKARIHNANMLGATLLARVNHYISNKDYLELAHKSMKFSVERQNLDGSWYYGVGRKQKWIDNFHTGYNLIALRRYEEYTQDMSFHNNLMKGYEFYKKKLFTKNGKPKYYDNSFYPVDIHTCAVSILVFLEFGDVKRAKSILDWTIEKMWNRKGYFNYQITRFYKNTIPYMRWSQAWMLYAMMKMQYVKHMKQRA